MVPAQPLPGSTGNCFSVDSISASLKAPVDVGIYCYADDGMLTAARVAFGTLTLAGAAGPAPPTLDLPGPVTGGAAAGPAEPAAAAGDRAVGRDSAVTRLMRSHDPGVGLAASERIT